MIGTENQPLSLDLTGTGCAEVAVLSGGRDKPYGLGLIAALTTRGIRVDFVGSDEFAVPEVLDNPLVRFLNLRGDQEPATFWRRAFRLTRYYYRLVRYALTTNVTIFHVLWNNYFELFDRTVLMVLYRGIGKRVVLTAHNVNARERDSTDNWSNRLSLKIQYALSDCIFVHTSRMKSELEADFGVPGRKVRVIPFGVNNTVPNTTLTATEAKKKLGLDHRDKALLFFGSIAPYKGLDSLVKAFAAISTVSPEYRLIVAGMSKGSPEYWNEIRREIHRHRLDERIISRIEFIPDEQTELYFKAGDVLVLPYTFVFQSGVLFLSYSFGLPVIATDVGSLGEHIVIGETGMICRPSDVNELRRVIEAYFASALYLELEERRSGIREYANARYSWSSVGETTHGVYTEITRVNRGALSIGSVR